MRGFGQKSKLIVAAVVVNLIAMVGQAGMAVAPMNALADLVKRLSGETEWSAGLAKLMVSETRRKTVSQVHSYLSAYGTHEAAQPSAGDPRAGLLLAFAAVRTLLRSEPA